MSPAAPLEARPAAPPLRAGPLVAGVLLGLALLMAAMIVAHWPWLEQAVATEDAPLAWLQSSLLWSAATLALLLALAERAGQRGWAGLALMLACLALDERFMGHERLKDWLLFHAFDGDPQRMGLWGDAPMLGYGIGGLLVLAWLRRQRWPRPALRLMVAAVLVGCGALALDLFGRTLAWQALEECGEALAEALFCCGLLLRAQGLLAQVQPSSAA